MLTDPWFYLAAVPAVLLYGIAKGGFGGAISIVSVPMMALMMPPTQAAAILLPILVVMDALVVKAYWGVFDRRALYLLLPGALVGVGIGYLSAEAMNEHYMRILIGVLSLVFGMQSLFGLKSFASKDHHPVSGSLFGALAGFTSFSIHAGGPPFTMYLMPKQLSPLLFAGTAGIFFAVVNVVKLVPLLCPGPVHCRQPVVFAGAGASCAVGCKTRSLPGAQFNIFVLLFRDQFLPGAGGRKIAVGRSRGTWQLKAPHSKRSCLAKLL